MKNSRIFLLAGMMLTAVNMNVASEPVPKVTDGIVDLEQYLFGDVDSNGQTILHRIAGNCDNDNFTVRIKLFDFLENADKSESAQAMGKKIEMYNALLQVLPKELVAVAVLEEINDFVQIKDNNGNTALDIVKKRNTLNPHKRCDGCLLVFQEFEKINELFKKNN
ncbi:MAG TPA: hypothetical protein VKU36_04700 [Candidatus Babeliales bacterium]|nr:hypothetical protein [Candidatus Babeliales bacterium]